MTNRTRGPLIEAIVAFVLAILIEASNRLFFESTGFGTMLAIQTAVVGALLSGQRWALTESYRADVTGAVEPIATLSKYVDLQQRSNYSAIATLGQRYAAVTEAEFRPVKDAIVAEAEENLRRLAVNKRSATLQTTQYYEWLFGQFDRAVAGEYIHAVSLASDEEWNDSQLEKNFLECNLRAASRGVSIVRIFVVTDARYNEFARLPPIALHRTSAGSGLNGHRVSREELERYDRAALMALGEGFIDFNGVVGLEDKFDSDGQARGQVTMLREDLLRMNSLYLRLLNMASPMN